MIFITIGTQQQNFARLFAYVNQMETKEEIVIQKGKSSYPFREGIRVYDYLSYEEMEHYFKKARLIITHGGGGTIFKALQLGKKVLVVPRMHQYGEHVNDHQLEIARYLEDKNLCLVATNYEEFQDALQKMDTMVFSPYVSSEKKFVRNVSKEIDKLLEE